MTLSYETLDAVSLGYFALSEDCNGSIAFFNLAILETMKVFPTYTHHFKDYSLPYWLPEGRKGRMQITIHFEPAGARLPVVSMRNALFMGLRRTELVLDKALGIHTLQENGHGTWMSSMPQEIEQHHRQLAGLKGRVLIGGLGLGLAPALLNSMEEVEQVVVVEKSFEVLDLVGKYIPKKKVSIVHTDLYEYLLRAKKKKMRFDCAFYDIWCSTGERTLLEHIHPLKQLSQGIVSIERIQCWNEDEMLGQVRSACQNLALFLTLEKGHAMRGILDCPQEKWDAFKTHHGLAAYFCDWVRNARPSVQQLTDRVDEFIADARNPVTFAKKWK